MINSINFLLLIFGVLVPLLTVASLALGSYEISIVVRRRIIFDDTSDISAYTIEMLGGKVAVYMSTVVLLIAFFLALIVMHIIKAILEIGEGTFAREFLDMIIQEKYEEKLDTLSIRE